MKSFLKRFFPFATIPQIFRGFLIDFSRYIKYTSCTRLPSHKSQENLVAKIVAQYHALEKGLCMPEFRYGFGNSLLSDLLDSVGLYSSVYGYDHQCLRDTASAISEYFHIHADHMSLLNGRNVKRGKQFLEDMFSLSTFELHQQDTIESHECFKNSIYFHEFALSRRSHRFFDGTPVSLEKLKQAIDIARSAPSSCNRQSSHVHIYTNKLLVSQLLDLQGGNRGYGHLGGGLLLVTSDIKKTINVNERHMPFVDGGIFVMSLLYALHSQNVAACPLNCYFPPRVESNVRKLSGIGDNECIVAMVICGNLSGKIMAVKSPRFPLNTFYTVHTSS